MYASVLDLPVPPMDVHIYSSEPMMRERPHNRSRNVHELLAAAEQSHYSKYRPENSNSDDKFINTVYIKEDKQLSLKCNTSTYTKPEAKLIWLRDNVEISPGKMRESDSSLCFSIKSRTSYKGLYNQF